MSPEQLPTPVRDFLLVQDAHAFCTSLVQADCAWLALESVTRLFDDMRAALLRGGKTLVELETFAKSVPLEASVSLVERSRARLEQKKQSMASAAAERRARLKRDTVILERAVTALERAVHLWGTDVQALV